VDPSIATLLTSYRKLKKEDAKRAALVLAVARLVGHTAPSVGDKKSAKTLAPKVIR